MVQVTRKNLLRRYRANKNANSINAECVRFKKIILDSEQLKKKAISGVGTRKKAKKSGAVNQQVYQRVNQRLDETEEMVRRMY